MPLITEIDRVLVDFLVKTGGLPPFAEQYNQHCIKRANNNTQLLVVKTQTVDEAINNINNQLSELFDEAEEKIITALEERGHIKPTSSDRKLVENLTEEQLSDMPETVSDEVAATAEHARKIVQNELINAGIELQKTDFDERILNELRNKIYQFSEDTRRRLAGDVGRALAEGYEEGMGIDEIVRNMRSEFDEIRDYRLENIARTEVNTGQNWGKQESMQEYGVSYKQWITAADEKVRGRSPEDEFDHVQLHGQVVKVSDTFKHPVQNWQLSYPGDRSGPIGAWINCRCTMRSYIPSEDERQRIAQAIATQGYWYPSGGLLA